MKFQTSRIALSARHAVWMGIALSGLMGGAAQADDWLRPGTVYGAASIGLFESGYECSIPGDVPASPAICDRPRAGGKIFGGYRFTPNLAAEVSYFYLGNFRRDWGAQQSPRGELSNKARNSAVSLAIDWSNEVFQVLTTHVRFGLAIARTDRDIAYANGTSVERTDYATKPYLGLGLSYQLSPNLRFYSGYDLIRNKDNNHFHVLSLGVGIEN